MQGVPPPTCRCHEFPNFLSLRLIFQRLSADLAKVSVLMNRLYAGMARGAPVTLNLKAYPWWVASPIPNRKTSCPSPAPTRMAEYSAFLTTSEGEAENPKPGVRIEKITRWLDRSTHGGEGRGSILPDTCEGMCPHKTLSRESARTKRQLKIYLPVALEAWIEFKVGYTSTREFPHAARGSKDSPLWMNSVRRSWGEIKAEAFIELLRRYQDNAAVAEVNQWIEKMLDMFGAVGSGDKAQASNSLNSLVWRISSITHPSQGGSPRKDKLGLSWWGCSIPERNGYVVLGFFAFEGLTSIKEQYSKRIVNIDLRFMEYGASFDGDIRKDDCKEACGGTRTRAPPKGDDGAVGATLGEPSSPVGGSSESMEWRERVTALREREPSAAACSLNMTLLSRASIEALNSLVDVPNMLDSLLICMRMADVQATLKLGTRAAGRSALPCTICATAARALLWGRGQSAA
ncbi:hypothetical protein B0H13DRAFT_1851247 [Mycena leptocephala]|nr:hypothetical protein B0H13DRAFT_1851247 [Mycena leptocephala]